MRQNKRSIKKSIRVREDIAEIADNLCKELDYSHADIYEIGVLLLENNAQHELVLQEQIYDGLIKKFESLSENVRKDCNNIQSRIISEIQSLQQGKNSASKVLADKNGVFNENKVISVVDEIIDLINKRESLPEYKKEGLEPLGQEYYEMKSNESGVPFSLIIEELEKRGYDSNRLLDLGMSPEHKWRGYVKSDDQLLAKRSV